MKTMKARGFCDPLLINSVSEELFDDRRIGESRNVAHVSVVLRHFAQYASHDLTGACLGQSGGILNDVGGGKGTDFLSN